MPDRDARCRLCCHIPNDCKWGGAGPCEDYCGESSHRPWAASPDRDARAREVAETIVAKMIPRMHVAWDEYVVLVKRALVAFAKEERALPPCPDCAATRTAGSLGYAPCVRHGGAEHGFDPRHGRFFTGWDDSWEHQKRRAEEAERQRDAARRLLDNAARMYDSGAFVGENLERWATNLFMFEMPTWRGAG